MRIDYGVYVRKGLAHPTAGNGTGSTLVTLNSGFSGAPDDSWLIRKLPKARTVFRSNSRDAQARMCALGVGLAILPVPLGDSVARIERVHLGEAPPSRHVSIGYHRDMRNQARLRALLALVIKRLSN
jgi:DNA-binding transcriptional LysR family regulator